ncbi:AAA family ATPase [Kitasatospora sp. NPDC096204]|uniref:helix-turn-helix transcriptional regulator n=1 Tax=Kitasatospora sp. NPDC096204 TaxID=3364094 RepID=UPI003823547E
MTIMDTVRDEPEDHGARPASAHGTGTLFGRGAELERLRRHVRREPGTSGALVLVGSEGIGKSRLLRTACEQAAGAGAVVLTAQGWAPESGVPYGLLRHLLAPLTDRVPALGGPHRQALRAALAIGPDATAPSVPSAQSAPSAPSAPFAPSAADVAAGTAALLERSGGPGHGCAPGLVLIAVDDAHACDRPTLELLGSLVRRAEGSRVSLLLASRDDEALLDLPADVELLHVAPLSPRFSAALLDSVPGAPVGRTRLEVLEGAEGNPSALLELCRRRASADPALARERTPRLRNLRTRFDTLIAPLPARTRTALLYAAVALPGDDAAAVMAALDTSDLGIWTPAEEAGIVALIDGHIVFRHPLARVAASAGQSAAVLTRAHRDLAERAGGRPLDRARHLVAAAVVPDASLTEDLRAAARHSADDFTLARALEDAARFSTSAGERARFLAGALDAAVAVGDLDWVRSLHARFLSVNSDPRLTREADLAVATALSHSSRQKEAFALLLDSADRHPSAGAAIDARSVTLASAIAEQSGLPEHRARLSELVAGLRDAGLRDASLRESGLRDAGPGPEGARASGPGPTGVLAGFVRGTETRPRSASRAVEGPDALMGSGPLDGRDQLTRRLAIASVGYLSDEPGVTLEHYRAADTYLRGRRAFGLRAWHLAPLLDTLLATGQWSEVSARVEEATDQAAVLRLTRPQADLAAFDLSLRALRGTAPANLITWPEVPFDGYENAATRARLVRAVALVAMSHTEWADAYRWLRRLFAEDGTPVHPFLSSRCVAELALAAQRAGTSEDAAEVLARVRSVHGERPTVRMTLLLHHATALLDPGPDPEHHFRLALVNAEGEQWPVERAQARFSYAIWLRRARRPSEARQQLVAALDTADVLGFQPFAAAIRQELRASGVANNADSAVESAASLDGLTAQQQQIVRLAAQGLSNREIGEQLFVSPRTVGSHLYNVYPKLGVSSRHQLRDLLQSR